MLFIIHNQTIDIYPSRTDITIHHAPEHGGDKQTSFPFSIMDAEKVSAIKHYPTYWWLATLHKQIKEITFGKQLQLFN